MAHPTLQTHTHCVSSICSNTHSFWTHISYSICLIAYLELRQSTALCEVFLIFGDRSTWRRKGLYVRTLIVCTLKNSVVHEVRWGTNCILICVNAWWVSVCLHYEHRPWASIKVTVPKISSRAKNHQNRNRRYFHSMLQLLSSESIIYMYYYFKVRILIWFSATSYYLVC